MLVMYRIWVLLTQLHAIEPVPGSYPPGLAAQLETDAVRDECFAAEIAEGSQW